MKGKPAKGGRVVKSPKISASPGTIKNNMSQEGNTDKVTSEKQLGARGKQMTGNNKSGRNRTVLGTGILNQSIAQ